MEAFCVSRWKEGIIHCLRFLLLSRSHSQPHRQRKTLVSSFPSLSLSLSPVSQSKSFFSPSAFRRSCQFGLIELIGGVRLELWSHKGWERQRGTCHYRHFPLRERENCGRRKEKNLFRFQRRRHPSQKTLLPLFSLGLVFKE